LSGRAPGSGPLDVCEDPSKRGTIHKKPLHLTLVTQLDRLGDGGNCCLECQFADEPVDGITSAK
jgi:hypothetical protein